MNVEEFGNLSRIACIDSAFQRCTNTQLITCADRTNRSMCVGMMTNPISFFERKEEI